MKKTVKRSGARSSTSRSRDQRLRNEVQLPHTVEALQRELSLEKLHHANAREEIIVLNAQINVTVDIIKKLRRQQQENFEEFQEVFIGDFHVNQEQEEAQSITELAQTVLVPEEKSPLSLRSFNQGIQDEFGDSSYQEDIETLHGPGSSPELQGIFDSVGEIKEHFTRTEPEIIPEDVMMQSKSVSPLQRVDVVEEDNDSLLQESLPSMNVVHSDPELERVNLRGLDERFIISEAIREFSSTYPRKWVDSCKKELKDTFNIDIGSSSLTTRKFQEK